MNLARSLTERLSKPDWIQLAALFFASLLFIWFIAWPTQGRLINDSWFVLSQARMIGLALLSLGYGSALTAAARAQQRSTLLAVIALGVLTLPLELIAYALSYPPQPLGYVLGLTLLDTVSLFGLGLALGKLFKSLYLGFLVPLLAPAALVGLVFLDVLLGATVTNPLTALSAFAPVHLAVMTLLAAATVVYLSRSEPRTEDTP